jgi:hypothetical protein
MCAIRDHRRHDEPQLTRRPIQVDRIQQTDFRFGLTIVNQTRFAPSFLTYSTDLATRGDEFLP